MKGRNRAAPPSRGLFRRPCGFIDLPEPEAELPREPVQVFGWCLSPRTTVAAIDVSVNGLPPARARLAMERGDIPRFTRHPSAPISAFEFKCDLAALPAEAQAVRFEATARAMDGRELVLKTDEFPLSPPAPPFTDSDGRAAQ